MPAHLYVLNYLPPSSFVALYLTVVMRRSTVRHRGVRIPGFVTVPLRISPMFNQEAGQNP